MNVAGMCNLRDVKRYAAVILLLCVLCCDRAYGQGGILIRHPKRDTSYIKDYYKNHLVIRAFESTKYNNFRYREHAEKLIYKPNEHNNLGIGFNYRFISLNLGLYFPFLDKNRDIYGKTKYLDLQTHVYLQKFIIDLYAQFYKGYYLANASNALNNYQEGQVVKRPDMATGDVSIVFQYIFNDKRFSYNAAFYQNERQKKSAGSFLVGGGIYHSNARGDSALIPSNIKYTNFFNNNPFTFSNNNSFGFNAGYAYTLVIKKNFFITASLCGGAGLGHSALSNASLDEKTAKFGAEFNLTERFAAGYNSDNYFAGITYIRLVTEDNTAVPNTWQEVNTGNFRFTVAKRFKLKKALIPKNEMIKSE